MSKGTVRPPSFIGKTYAIIADQATDHLVSWDHEGETFSVRNPERLAQDVFPSVFSHASYPSFTRALNAYGFRQVARNKWKHPDFRRGGLALLDSIQRRRKPGKRPPAAGAGADVGAGAAGVAEPPVQLELLGFSAAGCMALIESQRRTLSELQTDIASLRGELRSARSEELRLQSTVTGVLSVLVNEYGRPAIESALGCVRKPRRRPLSARARAHPRPLRLLLPPAPLRPRARSGPLESFMAYASAQGMGRAAHEWLGQRDRQQPRITYEAGGEEGEEGAEGRAGGGEGEGGALAKYVRACGEEAGAGGRLRLWLLLHLPPKASVLVAAAVRDVANEVEVRATSRIADAFVLPAKQGGMCGVQAAGVNFAILASLSRTVDVNRVRQSARTGARRTCARPCRPPPHARLPRPPASLLGRLGATTSGRCTRRTESRPRAQRSSQRCAACSARTASRSTRATSR